MEGEADRPASAEDGPDEVTLVPGTGVSPRAGASGAGPAPADSSDDLLEGMDEDRIIERAREIEDEVTLASLPVLRCAGLRRPCCSDRDIRTPSMQCDSGTDAWPAERMRPDCNT